MCRFIPQLAPLCVKNPPFSVCIKQKFEYPTEYPTDYPTPKKAVLTTLQPPFNRPSYNPKTIHPATVPRASAQGPASHPIRPYPLRPETTTKTAIFQPFSHLRHIRPPTPAAAQTNPIIAQINPIIAQTSALTTHSNPFPNSFHTHSTLKGRFIQTQKKPAKASQQTENPQNSGKIISLFLYIHFIPPLIILGDRKTAETIFKYTLNNKLLWNIE